MDEITSTPKVVYWNMVQGYVRMEIKAQAPEGPMHSVYGNLRKYRSEAPCVRRLTQNRAYEKPPKRSVLVSDLYRHTSGACRAIVRVDAAARRWPP
jgi:hypothetical protein